VPPLATSLSISPRINSLFPCLEIDSSGVKRLALVENYIKHILSPFYSNSTKNSNVSLTSARGSPFIDPLVSITQIKSIGNL